MSYQPPFTITAEILNRVSRISEQVGAINAALLQGSPTLRKQNRIKTITGTLQQADCTDFVAFMLKIIEATLDKHGTVNDPVNGTVNPAQLETSEAVRVGTDCQSSGNHPSADGQPDWQEP